MKLKDNEIVALEVVGDVVLSIVNQEGHYSIIPNTDTRGIEGGTLTEVVTDFTRNGDTLEWRGQIINLDQ